MSFADYLARVVNDARVQRGRQKRSEQAALLGGLRQRFGVPAGVLLALWGIESDFGRAGTTYPVVGALATLAFEGRRADYFRKELIDALWILDDGGIPPGELKGSWAGAMGQMQFMPSTYRRFALDWDGDGRRDIWLSTADALASAANYLSQSGWRPGQAWGEEVVAPAGLDPALVGRDKARPAADWDRFGVRSLAGQPLDGDGNRALVLPDGPGGRAYLVGANVNVLMLWNRSIYFALSVAQLADRIDTE